MGASGVLVVVGGTTLPVPSFAATDCTIREPSRDNPSWTCRQASEWTGACIPASAFQSWDCLEMDTDATLCDDAPAFNLTVYLSTDDVILDCNDQVIDHDWHSGDAQRSGIRTPYSYSISGVTVENCAIQNVGGYGVDLKRFFRGDQLNGPMIGHRGVRLENLLIANTERIGIYVGQNSRASSGASSRAIRTGSACTRTAATPMGRCVRLGGGRPQITTSSGTTSSTATTSASPGVSSSMRPDTGELARPGI